MAILNWQIGTVGQVSGGIPQQQPPFPTFVYISTNDTSATVTTAGYLNTLKNEGFSVNKYNMALVYTTDSGCQLYQITVNASGIITLVADVNPGNVLLPVVVGRVATFTNLAGQIGDTVTVATHQGSFQAGSAVGPTPGSFISFPAASGGVNDKFIFSATTSGGNFTTTVTNAAQAASRTYTIPDGGANSNFILNNNAAGQSILTGSFTVTTSNVIAGNSAVPNAGNFQSFPAASGGANDKLVLAATTSGGNFTTTITNRAMGQASTISFADPANANGSLLIAATTTPFTANHSMVASGTGGLIADAGYQMKVVAQAAVAGGAAAQTVMDAFCTAASMVVCTWNDTTNAVSIQKAVAGNGSFVVTSSADPGASHINYIITKV